MRDLDIKIHECLEEDLAEALPQEFQEQALGEWWVMAAHVEALRDKDELLDMRADTIDRSFEQVAERCHQHRIDARKVHDELADLRTLRGRIVQHLEESREHSTSLIFPSGKTPEAEHSGGYAHCVSGTSDPQQDDAKPTTKEKSRPQLQQRRDSDTPRFDQLWDLLIRSPWEPLPCPLACWLAEGAAKLLRRQ